MYNLCYRFLGNQPEAEDVLQEAFLNAFRNINTFQGRSSFGSWLKKIVINKALSQLKKSDRNMLEYNNVPEVVIKSKNTSDEEQRFELRRVRKGIEKLPNGFRIVLSLYLLEGYDHGEIAKILDISESTSKTQYSRAKKRLRELLKTNEVL